MKKENKLFRNIIIIVVLIIPFMYSFFYLKAYWNPYGEGNIDNLPVAVINSDTGDKGNLLIKSIKKSKKLKLSILDKKEAEEGLNNGKYYAIINIPSDFTKDIESAGTTNKVHPTITYQPNQKSNYLSSQIINTVMVTVEKSLDNEINSGIVDSLSTSINEVPDNLDQISTGFSKLSDGTTTLENGSKDLDKGALTLYKGTNTLKNGTTSLKGGISKLKNGSKTLESGSTELNTGINNAYLGSTKIKEELDKKITSLKKDNSSAIDDETLNNIKETSVDTVKKTFTEEYKNKIGISAIESTKSTYNNNLTKIVEGLKQYGINAPTYCVSDNVSESFKTYCDNYKSLKALLTELDNPKSTIYMTIYNVAVTSSVSASEQTASIVSTTVAKQVATKAKETSIKESISSLEVLSSSLNELNNGLYKLNVGSKNLTNGLSTLSSGINELESGALTLNSGASELNNGALSLSDGTHKLYNGVTTLNSSVKNSKIELDNKINDTKDDLKKVESLTDYAKEPVKLKTKEVNKVSSYGTAFAPLFISIALWVGSLMMFIVLYYDKNERFGLLSISSSKRVKRMFAYHLLATISGILLAFLLQVLLDFEITNIFLYYFIIVLTSNCFLAILEFLIENFSDVGKFIGLIVLVLQLAAAGGTFPIETVTKCFRFLNPILPMTYTIRLIKESIISVESSLLIKNLIIVLGITLVFVLINLILNIIKQKKNN